MRQRCLVRIPGIKIKHHLMLSMNRLLLRAVPVGAGSANKKSGVPLPMGLVGRGLFSRIERKSSQCRLDTLRQSPPISAAP